VSININKLDSAQEPTTPTEAETLAKSAESRSEAATPLDEQLLDNTPETLLQKTTPSEFKKLKYEGKYSQMLSLISSIKTSEQLLPDTEINFDFKNNRALEIQVGLGDIMPPSVRTIIHSGQEYTRRANQGFYSKTGRYLAIITGTSVRIGENNPQYSDTNDQNFKATFGDKFSESGSLDLSKDQENNDPIDRKTLLTIAKDYGVDPAFLESTITNQENNYQSNYEHLHLTARYLANAAAKFEALGQTTVQDNAYTPEFANYALSRLNTATEDIGKPKEHEQIVINYGQAKNIDNYHIRVRQQPPATTYDSPQSENLKPQATPSTTPSSRLALKEAVKGDLQIIETTLTAQESPTGEPIYLNYSQNPELKSKPPHYIMFFGGNGRTLNDTLEQSQIKDKVEKMQRSGINAVLVVPAPKGNERDHQTTARWSHITSQTFREIENHLTAKGLPESKWNFIAWSGGYKGLGNMTSGVNSSKISSITMLDATYNDSHTLNTIAHHANKGVLVQAFTQGNAEAKTNIGATSLADRITNKESFFHHNFQHRKSHFEIGNGELLLNALAQGTELLKQQDIPENITNRESWNRFIFNQIVSNINNPEFERLKSKGKCESMAARQATSIYDRLSRAAHIPRNWQGIRNSPIAPEATTALRGKKISQLTSSDIDFLQPGQVMFMALPDRYPIQSQTTDKARPIPDTARHWVTYLGKDQSGQHIFQDNLKKYDTYNLATLIRIFGERRDWTNHHAAPKHGISERVVISIHDPYQDLRHLDPRSLA
jgi:hypothetical protein